MSDFNDLVQAFIQIINLLVPLVFAVTVIVIIWGIIKAWIINVGDENSVTEGKNLALAGVLALIVMSGLWGIITLLTSSLFG